jgi:hypothetical protein
MLAHELIHLKRRDLLWAWLPNLGRVLFFFHPLVWVAEGEWRMSHEMACDEQAVLATGAVRTHYAAMLLAALARLGPENRSSLLRAGVVESYGTIRRRLAAVRQFRAPSPRRRAATAVALLALALVGTLPWRLTARAAPAAASRTAVAPLAAVPVAARPVAVRQQPIQQASRPERESRPSRPARKRPGASLHRPARAAPIRQASRPPSGRRVPRRVVKRPWSETPRPAGDYGREVTAPPGSASLIVTNGAAPADPPTLKSTEEKDEELARLVEMKLRAWKEAQAGSLFLPPLHPKQLVFAGPEESIGSFTAADRAKEKAMLLEKLKRAGVPEEKLRAEALSAEPAATEGSRDDDNLK